MTPLPYKIRVPRLVRPVGLELIASDRPWELFGDYAAKQNPYGAVVAVLDDGREVGVKPHEYDMVDVARDSFWCWCADEPARIEELLGCATPEFAARAWALDAARRHEADGDARYLDGSVGMTIRVRDANKTVTSWLVFVRNELRVSSISPLV